MSTYKKRIEFKMALDSKYECEKITLQLINKMQ